MKRGPAVNTRSQEKEAESKAGLADLKPLAFVDSSGVESVAGEVMTETITIQVDPETAKAYKAAPPDDQKKMQALLSLWLKDLATAEPVTLKEIMSYLSHRAKARGLTPEVLESLLKET